MKADINMRKRGVSFEEASAVFEDFMLELLKIRLIPPKTKKDLLSWDEYKRTPIGSSALL